MNGERLTAVLIAAVALSLAMTPTVAELGRSLAGRLRRRRLLPAADAELIPRGMTGPALIVGMGRRGRAIAGALAEFGIGYAAVERDLQRLNQAVADGYTVAYDDASDPRLWSAVAMEGRRVSILTAPSLEVATGLDHTARIFFPNLKQFAAIVDAEAGAAFAALGLVPVFDGGDNPGLSLAVAVLTELDVSAELIEAWIVRQGQRPGGHVAKAQVFAA